MVLRRLTKENETSVRKKNDGREGWRYFEYAIKGGSL